MEKSEADVYFDRGINYQRARELLVNGCAVPPSFEVFEEQLTVIQKTEPLVAPVHVAQQIVSNYHRVPFSS